MFTDSSNNAESVTDDKKQFHGIPEPSQWAYQEVQPELEKCAKPPFYHSALFRTEVATDDQEIPETLNSSLIGVQSALSVLSQYELATEMFPSQSLPTPSEQPLSFREDVSDSDLKLYRQQWNDFVRDLLDETFAQLPERPKPLSGLPKSLLSKGVLRPLTPPKSATSNRSYDNVPLQFELNATALPFSPKDSTPNRTDTPSTPEFTFPSLNDPASSSLSTGRVHHHENTSGPHSRRLAQPNPLLYTKHHSSTRAIINNLRTSSPLPLTSPSNTPIPDVHHGNSTPSPASSSLISFPDSDMDFFAHSGHVVDHSSSSSSAPTSGPSSPFRLTELKAVEENWKEEERARQLEVERVIKALAVARNSDDGQTLQSTSPDALSLRESLNLTSPTPTSKKDKFTHDTYVKVIENEQSEGWITWPTLNSKPSVPSYTPKQGWHTKMSSSTSSSSSSAISFDLHDIRESELKPKQRTLSMAHHTHPAPPAPYFGPPMHPLQPFVSMEGYAPPGHYYGPTPQTQYVPQVPMQPLPFTPRYTAGVAPVPMAPVQVAPYTLVQPRPLPVAVPISPPMQPPGWVLFAPSGRVGL